MRTKYNRMFTEQPCVKKPMKYDNPFTRVTLQITVHVLGIKNHQRKFYVKKANVLSTFFHYCQIPITTLN